MAQSSWWRGTSRERYIEAEKNMLARHTGIPYKEFDIQDIEI